MRRRSVKPDRESNGWANAINLATAGVLLICHRLITGQLARRHHAVEAMWITRGLRVFKQERNPIGQHGRPRREIGRRLDYVEAVRGAFDAEFKAAGRIPPDGLNSRRLPSKSTRRDRTLELAVRHTPADR